MKIISDFRDYYDAMKAYGEEPGCLYKRYQEIIGLESKIEELRNTNSIGQCTLDQKYTSCYSGFIAFCGLGYKFYALESYNLPTKFIYNSKTFYNLINVDRLKKEFMVSRWNTQLSSKWLNPARLDKEFNLYLSKDEFIKYNVPVYAVINKTWLRIDGDLPVKGVHNQPGIWYGAKLIINPKLSDFAFQQIVDPYQCWQQISQFITNELNKDTEPTQVGDDEVMIITKGFDPITSFRSGKPGEKKVRRKENKERKKK